MTPSMANPTATLDRGLSGRLTSARLNPGAGWKHVHCSFETTCSSPNRTESDR